MARQKPKNVFLIRDVDGVNQALAELGEIKRRIDGIETEMNEKIDQAKMEAGALCAPLQARREALESGVLAFAEYNREELFQKKKSLKLDFGSIGYRKSTSIKTLAKTTWAMVLGRIKELKFTEAIRTKEDVNREVLQTWPDERLVLVGAKRVEEDTFWIELKEESLLAGADAPRVQGLAQGGA